MKSLELLNAEEVILINGGSELSRKIGYCVGEVVDFAESAQIAYVAALYSVWQEL